MVCGSRDMLSEIGRCFLVKNSSLLWDQEVETSHLPHTKG